MDIIVSYTLLHYRIMIKHHQPQPHKEWTYHTELISLVQLKKNLSELSQLFRAGTKTFLSFFPVQHYFLVDHFLMKRKASLSACT